MQCRGRTISGSSRSLDLILESFNRLYTRVFVKSRQFALPQQFRIGSRKVVSLDRKCPGTQKSGVEAEYNPSIFDKETRRRLENAYSAIAVEPVFGSPGLQGPIFGVQSAKVSVPSMGVNTPARQSTTLGAMMKDKKPKS